MQANKSKRPIFQGDVAFVRVAKRDVPKAAQAVPRDGARVIVAHSETGHHHYLDGEGVTLLREPSNPLIAYLRVECATADVIHGRPYDTHETISLPRGTYRVVRQREYTPQGYRMVQD